MTQGGYMNRDGVWVGGHDPSAPPGSGNGLIVVGLIAIAAVVLYVRFDHKSDYEAIITADQGHSCVIFPSVLAVDRGEKVTFKSDVPVAVGAPNDHVDEFRILERVDGEYRYEATLSVDEPGLFECNDEDFLKQFEVLQSGVDDAVIARLDESYDHGLLKISLK